MGEWLFHRVKHLRQLGRYIEDTRESSSRSSGRDFDFLWGKIQDVPVQDREDASVRSMLGYLAPSVKNPKGAAAKADAIPPPPPPKPSAKPPAPDPKGLAAPEGQNPVHLSSYAQWLYAWGQLQAVDPKSGNMPKGKPKGKESPPKGKGGPIAKAMVALVAAASLCKPTVGSGPECSVECCR